MFNDASMKPICDSLEIKTFCVTDEIIQLAESVFCTNINLTLNLQDEYPGLREALTLLQKSPLRGKIRIMNSGGSWENCPDEDLFELAKDLRMVDFYSMSTAAPFRCFIRDLYKFPELCSLKRMCFNLGFGVYSEFSGEEIENLSFKLLYEGKDVNINYIDVFYKENECGMFYPTHVRKLETGNKMIFCVGNNSKNEQEVFIIDRTTGIIDGVDYATDGIKMLEIIVSKEFLEASDERQIEILKEEGAKYTFRSRH